MCSFKIRYIAPENYLRLNQYNGFQENNTLSIIKMPRTEQSAVRGRDSACAGGSNVGVMSIKAAVEVSGKTGRKKAALVCLPGISAEIPGIIEGTKTCAALIAIDGCSTQCAAKTLRKSGFDLVEIVLNRDCGIKKSHDIPDEVGLEKDIEHISGTIVKLGV